MCDDKLVLIHMVLRIW